MSLRRRKRCGFTPNEVQPVPESPERVTHAVYQILPYPADGVEVVYTKDPVEASAWLKNNVIDCDAKAVGFDIEWKPQFKKKKDGGMENKTSVLQLAVDSSCLVLHLHHMKTIPKLLRKVMKNSKIQKVGSGILQDLTKLKRDKGIECAGRADTQSMAQRLGVSRSDGQGLQKLSERFLGVQMKKPRRVSMSNWENFPLSFAQIEYAAMDAWIGLRLFNCMKQLIPDERVAEEEQFPEEKDSFPTFVEEEQFPEERGSSPTLKKEKFPDERDYFPTFVEEEHRHYSTAIIYCEVCGKKCKSERSLDEHKVKAAHARCEICGKRFPGKVIPKRHIKTCALRCMVCGKRFAGAAALDEHMKSTHF